MLNETQKLKFKLHYTRGEISPNTIHSRKTEIDVAKSLFIESEKRCPIYISFSQWRNWGDYLKSAEKWMGGTLA